MLLRQIFCFLKTRIMSFISLEKNIFEFSQQNWSHITLCTISVTGEEITVDIMRSSGPGAAAPGDSEWFWLWMEAGDSVHPSRLEYWSRRAQHWDICSIPGYLLSHIHLEAWFIPGECEIRQVPSRCYANIARTENCPGTHCLRPGGAGQPSPRHLSACHESLEELLPADCLFLVCQE